MRRLDGLLLLGLLGVGLGACSDSLPETEYPPAPPPEAMSGPEAKPPVPEGALRRSDVEEVVGQGLGNFLQLVQLEPELKQGRFSGFRVLALQPPNFWEGVDLQPGDVVTAVNGKSIEEPNDAFKVFEGLRHAKELRVSFRREGQDRQLVYPIVGEPKTPPRKSESKASNKSG